MRPASTGSINEHRHQLPKARHGAGRPGFSANVGFFQCVKRKAGKMFYANIFSIFSSIPSIQCFVLCSMFLSFKTSINLFNI